MVKKSKKVYYGGAAASSKGKMNKKTTNSLKKKVLGGKKLPQDRGVLNYVWQQILKDKEKECNKEKKELQEIIKYLEAENAKLIALLHKK